LSRCYAVLCDLRVLSQRSLRFKVLS
jgi:hypothetical protein